MDDNIGKALKPSPVPSSAENPPLAIFSSCLQETMDRSAKPSAGLSLDITKDPTRNASPP
jgi:hypothetical protein